MAQFQITIPDDQLDRVVNALCLHYGFEDQWEGPIENATENDRRTFARNAVKRSLRKLVYHVESTRKGANPAEVEEISAT